MRRYKIPAYAGMTRCMSSPRKRGSYIDAVLPDFEAPGRRDIVMAERCRIPAGPRSAYARMTPGPSSPRKRGSCKPSTLRT